MASQKKLLRSANCGVKLWQIDMMAGGTVAATAYSLESLRTPERPGFDSLAEADAAWLKEVELSEADPLVAQRLGRG